MKKRQRMMALLLAVALLLTGCNQVQGSDAKKDTDGGEKQVSQVSEMDFSKELTGDLRISAFDSMKYLDILEKAKELFEEKHPQVNIIIDTKSVMPEMQTFESTGDDGEGQMVAVTVMSGLDDDADKRDYISQVNKDLMSQTGADIYALDVLPIYQYIEKDMLENLSNYMKSDPDFKMTDYNESILDIFKGADNLYFMPTSYTFQYLKYNSSLFSPEAIEKLESKDRFSFQELLDTAKDSLVNMDENSFLFGFAVEYLFMDIFASNLSEYVNLDQKEVYFNQPAFKELLEILEAFTKEGVLRSSDSFSNTNIEVFDFENIQPEKYGFSFASNFDLLMDTFSTISGNQMFMDFQDSTQEKTLGLLENNGTIPVDFAHGYTINSQSNQKQLAWAFIKFLLSDEMQTDITAPIYSIPLRQESVKEISKRFLMNGGMGDLEWSEEADKDLEAYVKAIDSYSQHLNTYFFMDETITSMVREEMTLYFKGKRDINQVIDTLQSKVGLYVSE